MPPVIFTPVYVVIHHYYNASPYDREFPDGHDVFACSVHRTLREANRYIINFMNDQEELNGFDEDGESFDVEEKDRNNTLPRNCDANYGSGGELDATRERNRNRIDHMWVERHRMPTFSYPRVQERRHVDAEDSYDGTYDEPVDPQAVGTDPWAAGGRWAKRDADLRRLYIAKLRTSNLSNRPSLRTSALARYDLAAQQERQQIRLSLERMKALQAAARVSSDIEERNVNDDDDVIYVGSKRRRTG